MQLSDDSNFKGKDINLKGICTPKLFLIYVNSEENVN